ncbi:MAG TPA: hypothetical protein VGV10_01765, partial [Thermoleophilaceae bacterium]|nr:hypothetical protein [Thermoleophilaceae bacterium]
DLHGLVVGWLAVPAGVYFLWVVQALYRGTFRDWNSTGRVVPEAAASPGARSKATDASAQATSGLLKPG